MKKKRIALAVGAGGCVIAGLWLNVHERSGSGRGPVRITNTVFVRDDGSPIRGLFDGLRPGSRLNLAAAVEQGAGGADGCVRNGFIKRLLAAIDTTVYGADPPPPCQPSICSGMYAGCFPVPCTAPNCSGTWIDCQNDLGPYRWRGFRTTADHGCTSAVGYECNLGLNDCSRELCDTGWAECTDNYSCVLGQYCDTVGTRTCVDSWCKALGWSADFYCRNSSDCVRITEGSPCDEEGCCAPPTVCCTEPTTECWMPYQVTASCDYAVGCEPGCPSDRYLLEGDCCTYLDSPVILDTQGDGFGLTGVADGVIFDLSATGVPVRTAWTEANSDDAWLVLDRNGNGYIDDGTELFGNRTPQPAVEEPNGFLALAVYDQPAEGGNDDGVVSSADRIWHALRLWFDANHDGKADAGELRTLDSVHVSGIELKYKQAKWADTYGNKFWFRAKTSCDKDGDAGHWAYDVPEAHTAVGLRACDSNSLGAERGLRTSPRCEISGSA